MAMRKCRECGSAVSSRAKTCPSCGVKRPVKHVSKVGIALLVLFGVGVVAAESGRAPSPSSSHSADRNHVEEKNPDKNVFIVESRHGGFDTVMISDLTIKNTNAFPIRDTTILCAQFAPSGTQLPVTKAVIYERLKPDETRTFHDETRTFHNVNFGTVHPQSKSYRCLVACVGARLNPNRHTSASPYPAQASIGTLPYPRSADHA